MKAIRILSAALVFLGATWFPHVLALQTWQPSGYGPNIHALVTKSAIASEFTRHAGLYYGGEDQAFYPISDWVVWYQWSCQWVTGSPNSWINVWNDTQYGATEGALWYVVDIADPWLVEATGDLWQVDHIWMSRRYQSAEASVNFIYREVEVWVHFYGAPHPTYDLTTVMTEPSVVISNPEVGGNFLYDSSAYPNYAPTPVGCGYEAWCYP